MKKIKFNRKYIIILIILLVIIVSLFLTFTKTTEIVELENGTQVELNSELIYYLNVSYDGVDRESYDSRIQKDGVSSKLFSGDIYVEDRIPDGLVFQNFITVEDGTVGAVNKVTGKACSGSVVNESDLGEYYTVNINGLHYSKTTHTVSFRVRDLQAGCQLTIGIVTKTPSKVDDLSTSLVETRRDFYNFASAREDNFLKQSNTVHAFIQNTLPNLYNVTYEYEGTIPSNAPKLPDVSSYAANASVGLAPHPYLEGYEFSGWKVKRESGTSVTSTKTSFIMPASNVKVVGSFTKTTPHKVTYQVTGIPQDVYMPPEEKSYYKNKIITLDTMQSGDIVNGYRFLGWNYTNIIVSDNNEFTMPDEDVLITGEFEQVKYKVIYQFYDTGLPPNSDELLPDTEEYIPGDKVTLEKVKNEPDGYKFSGWYKEDNFEMPNEDVIIYGEWQLWNGDIHPKITKEIISKQAYYKKGDIVKYKIVVNNLDMDVGNLINVTVKEFNEKARFIDGEGYIVRTDHLVLIPVIEYDNPVTIYAEYEVTDEVGTIENIVQIIGGSSVSGAELDPIKEYIAKASFDIWPELKISKKVSNEDSNDKAFQFHITSDKGYDSWLNLTNNEEQVLYLEPDDTYYIKEVVPQEYTLESVTGDISGNGESIEIKLGEKYSAEFTNKHHRKGYYHSDGRVSNEVKEIIDDRPDNPGGGPSTTSLTVLKVWNDEGFESERPASVSVQLFRDGEAYGSPITLNDANNWRYTWKGLNSSYTWTIYEVDVPDGYTTSISQDGSTATITNTYNPSILQPPSPSPDPDPNPDIPEEPDPNPTPAEPDDPTPL